MQTIGDRLEEARKKKGISIREAAEGTKVRGEYLQKFESNQFDLGLSDIYVRGFLRCYAIYLKLPPERILNDYASLGHGEIRPRQPSREVYGRMDVSVASGDEEGTAPAEAPAAESPRTLHGPRIHSKPPIRPGINPALVFKAGIALVGLLVIVLLIWGLKALFGGGSSEPTHNLPAATAPVPRVADATVSITAQAADTDGSPLRIKVVRQSDGTELYQGPLPANEPREFPNVPLYVTATQIQSIIFEYKGKRYGAPAGLSGRRRMPVDFSNR
jgi:cytoskeleton protein RodZ